MNMKNLVPKNRKYQELGFCPQILHETRVYFVLYALFSMLFALSYAEDVNSQEPAASWEKWSGLPIISIDYGDFSEDRVREATVIKIGDVYSRSRIRKSIEQIYSLREFSHIEVDAEMAENGVKLTFILTEQIAVESVTLSGNKELGNSKLIRVMKLQPRQKEQEYSESIARADVDAIEKLYRSRGFFNTDISFDAYIDEEKRQAKVTFRISEGKRPVIKEIIFLGLNKAIVSDKDILKEMKKNELGKTYAGQEALNLDARNIVKTYREKGYITVKINPPLVLSAPDAIKEYDEKGKHFPAEDLTESDLENGSVVIVVEIQQGKKVEIEIIAESLDGKTKRNNDIEKSLAARMRSISEPVLRRSDEDIKKAYSSKGYYLAEVRHEVLADKTWNFDVDDDAEGWGALPGAATFQSLNGMLQVSTSDNTPQIQSPKMHMDADKYQKIQIRMKAGAGSVGQLRWTTNKGKTGYRSFKLASYDRFHNYEIDMRTFRITGRSLENLKKEGVPENIREKLKGLENQKFAGQPELTDGLRSRLGEQDFTRFRSLILKHAERRRDRNWFNRIVYLQFSLTDVPGTNVEVAWIKTKMTAEFIPVVFTVTKNQLMRMKTKMKIVSFNNKPLEVDMGKIRKQTLTRKRHFLAFWPFKWFVSDGILDEDVFKKDLKSIIALYKYLGYPQARIAYREINTNPEKGEIDVVIAIDEGAKTVVTEAIIESEAKNVLDYSQILSRLPGFQNGAEEVVTIVEEGPLRVRYGINPPKVFREEDTGIDRAYLISQYADKGHLAQIEIIKQLLLFAVGPGHEAHLNNGTIPALLRQEFGQNEIPLSQDITVSTQKMDSEWTIDDNNSGRTYIVRKREDKLKIYERLKDYKQFNEKNTEVVVIYRVTMGKQIRLDDKIVIRGYSRTKRRAIERELSKSLVETRIFNRTELTNSWQNLLDLGFLESVRISTESVGGSDELHQMIVDVKEKNAKSVNVHLGSDSTATFRGGLEASHINLLGTGQRISGKVQVGTSGTDYRFGYAKPWLMPWLLGARARGLVDVYRYSDVVNYNDTNGVAKDYTEVWTGSSLGVSHRLFRKNSITYGYRYEVVDYLDITDETDKVTNIGSVETTFRRDTRKNPLNPTDGWFHAITLEYADSVLGSDETFAKITANNMYYLQLSQKLVLALGARTGYTRILGGAERVLTPKRFNLDDYTTPRGYKWTADDVGNLMLNTSIELRFPLYKRINAALFFDSGYVYDQISDFDIGAINSSVGLGLRFITPIGPIRIDYGYPIRETEFRNKFPHLAFGHAF